MSSDLLGAFGAPDTKQSSHLRPQPIVSKAKLEQDDDDDDDFGEFEDVQKEYEDAGVQDNSRDLVKLQDDASIASRAELQEHRGWDQSGLTSHPQYSGGDEEWGDFAGEEVMFDADQYAQEPHVKFEDPKDKQQTPAVTENIDFDADDDWNPVDVPQAPIVPLQPPAKATERIFKPEREIATTVSMPVVKKDLGPPPTNIPPPSVLLSTITLMFQSLPAKFKKIVVSDRASSDPYEALDESRISALQNQVSQMRATARVIAGRKLRWKRDTMLSQSMRIGPAGQGGMKLSTVDKNETRREDQEVSEAVHIWRKQIGPLRSTIAKVNIHLPGEGLTIPDISENIPIRQGKASEGAIKGQKCCFLCGINRDERVAKVDVWVEDSFGEWWVEHWGHMDCVNFWKVVEGDLPHR